MKFQADASSQERDPARIFGFEVAPVKIVRERSVALNGEPPVQPWLSLCFESPVLPQYDYFRG